MKIKILIFLISAPLFAEVNSINSNKMIDLSKYQDNISTLINLNKFDERLKIKNDNQQLEVNSLVFINPSNDIKNLSGIISNNNFSYIRDIDLNDYKEESTPFKIINYVNEDNFMISDGSFIISFIDEVDYLSFAQDKNLILISSLPGINSALYKVKEVTEINSLILLLKENANVKYIDFNKINPFLVLQ